MIHLSRRQIGYLRGYLFISPWLLGLVLLYLGPMILSLYMSMTNWDLFTTPRFIGLENYSRMMQDGLFWKSLLNTVIYVGGRVPLVLLLALVVAILLNQNIPGRNFLRTAYYLPVVTPQVAMFLLWVWMFEPNVGIINHVLAWFGVSPGPQWLGHPFWAKPALIIVSAWGIGSIMVIFLAGLQGVPQQLYEAAELDGASAWHKVRHVTLPMITPVIFFNLIMGIIGSFQVFTKAIIMTSGGPANATLMYVLYLYNQAFLWFRMGYGAALAWVLFGILFAFTYIMFKRSAWVYYEGRR
ncbi:MAG TPA: sugar ABC transporter permease [Caldilineaceae bacterium]|nr:sugar ABC transporter permease [Caldilineaceae bacterium]